MVVGWDNGKGRKVHAVRAVTVDILCHCCSMATSKHSTRPNKLGENNRLDCNGRIDGHQRREALRGGIRAGGRTVAWCQRAARGWAAVGG